MSKLRPSVIEFAARMERNLAAKDEERGPEGWKGESLGWLLRRFRQEVGEAVDAMETLTAFLADLEMDQSAGDDGFSANRVKGALDSSLSELADVANFAMMMAERCKEIAGVPPTESVKGDWDVIKVRSDHSHLADAMSYTLAMDYATPKSQRVDGQADALSPGLSQAFQAVGKKER